MYAIRTTSATTKEATTFEHFTDRARRAISHAQTAARDFGHDAVGTEHILLGMLDVEDGLATKLLSDMEVSRDQVEREVERIVGRGTAHDTGTIPFSPRAKKVLELSLKIAHRMCHNYIGTEHLLLGILREGEGVAARILADAGVTAQYAQSSVESMLGDLRFERAARHGRRRFHRLVRWPLTRQYEDHDPARADRLTADLAGLIAERDDLAAEVDRLRDLLREQGIDPDPSAGVA